MQPKLSIITINRNNATGLRKTMESVFSQTGLEKGQLEYIIIDGASTDNSVEVINEFLALPENNEKVSYWVSEPDKGIYNAMNKGINHANGEYCLMLNSGDSLLPNVIKNILPKFGKIDALFCGVILERNGIALKTELRYPQILNTSTILHQGIIYKKSLHEKYGLYDEQYKYAADYDFTIKCFYINQSNIEYFYNPIVLFPEFGIGYSENAKNEADAIKEKYGFLTCNQKSTIKRIAKQIIPPFIIKALKGIMK